MSPITHLWGEKEILLPLFQSCTQAGTTTVEYFVPTRNMPHTHESGLQIAGPSSPPERALRCWDTSRTAFDRQTACAVR